MFPYCKNIKIQEIVLCIDIRVGMKEHLIKINGELSIDPKIPVM